MRFRDIFTNYNSKKTPTPTKSDRLAAAGRLSRINPETADQPTSFVVRPNEKTKSFSAQRVNIKDIFRKPIAESLPMLIESSSGLSRAVKVVKRYTVADYELVGDEDSKAIIQEFIDEMGKGNTEFLTVLKDIAYGVYVEGAACGELNFSIDGSTPLRIDWVSPFTLGFDRIHDEELGDIDLIGQTKYGRKLDVVLQDPREPNDTFFYEPTNRIGTNTFGSSEITPAIFGVASLADLLQMILQYIQGQVFPKGLFSIDIEPMIEAGYEKDEIDAAAALATRLIKGELSAADITQDIVMTTKVIYTLIGSMDKNNISGVEIIGDMFENIAQQGVGIPKVIYGNRKGTSGLNNNESETEMIAFFRDVLSWQTSIENPISDFFTVILRHYGNTGECRLLLDKSDAVIEKIRATIFDLKMTAYVKLNSLNVVTPEQMFGIVKEGKIDFNDPEFEFDPDNIEIPTPAALPAPEPEPEGESPDA